ncbi:MAG: hypothetical protein ACRDTH_03550 [Pseudonocardiaceae bacterium]
MTITRQLNGVDEEWPNRSVRDKWLSFSGSGMRTIMAENIQSFHLHFTPQQGGLFGDNWSMSAISIFYPKGDGLADPPFTSTIDTSQFNLLFSGTGEPWLHRFKENPDDEGSPDWSPVANPQWNPVAPQRNWRWCNRCQGLFFEGNNTIGACPAGGGHNSGGSSNYLMSAYTAPLPIGLQANWRWCNRCQGLFLGDTTGRCPLGDGHNSQGSSDYTPFLDDGVLVNKQDGWRSCFKCQGMFFAGNPTLGICPTGGGHDSSMSWHHMMVFSSREP